MSTQTNVRLPERTERLLNEIVDETGMSKTQVIIFGIEQYFDSLTPGERGMIEMRMDARYQEQPDNPPRKSPAELAES